MNQKPYTTEEFNKQAKQLLDLIAKCEELENRPVSGVDKFFNEHFQICLLYTSPSPRDTERSRMPSSA